MIVKPSRWATRFYDAYVFDMDGTIYLGDHLLPGARSLIEELRDRDIPVRFLTNNPTNDDVVADSIGLMARRGRGVGHMLPAPAIVSYVELGRRLCHEKSVADTLAEAPRADVLIFSPGVLEVGSVLVRSGFLTERGLRRLQEMGAVTDIFSRFLDCEGNPVSQELEERTIAIPLDTVRNAKMSIAVASGTKKAVPLAVALRSGLAAVAIVDEELAQAVLSQRECG